MWGANPRGFVVPLCGSQRRVPKAPKSFDPKLTSLAYPPGLVGWWLGRTSPVSKKNPDMSQFFITLKPLLQLDGKHVVFGRVLAWAPPSGLPLRGKAKRSSYTWG